MVTGQTLPFLEIDPNEAVDERWFVLHTRSRQEKLLSRDLTAAGVACYLPLVRQPRFYGRRKTIVEMPLFPGYVFLWGSPDQAYFADRTGRVAHLIPVVDQERIRWELRNIHDALSREVPFSSHPYLTEGVQVEVRSGPCKGVQGYVRSICRRTDRLVLQVNAFGRAVALEIDGALVEPTG